MDVLQSRRFTAFSNALVRLYEPKPLADFPQHLIEVVAQLFEPCELSFNDVDLATGAVTDIFTLRLENHDAWLARLAELIYENPVVGYIRRGGKRPVLKISDFLTQRQLHQTGFYIDVMRPAGMKYQLAVVLPLPGHAAGLTLNRDKDFPERDRFLLEALSPHVVRAYANANLLSELEEQRQRYPGMKPGTLHAMRLTPREAEVMHWLAEGKRDREIGIILNCSHRTVEKHVQRILVKLGVETRSAAVARSWEFAT